MILLQNNKTYIDFKIYNCLVKFLFFKCENHINHKLFDQIKSISQ